MADDTRSELRRALDDLSEGLSALLGFGHGNPGFVDELLERPSGDLPPRGAARGRGLTSPRRTGPRVAGTTRRLGRSRKNHLSLVT